MTGERKDSEPTQETPAGHAIPVPTREQVLGDLEKVAKPNPSQREHSPEQ
jgi:hypothetical protein